MSRAPLAPNLDLCILGTLNQNFDVITGADTMDGAIDVVVDEASPEERSATRLLAFSSSLMKRYKQNLLSAGKRSHPITPRISWCISLKASIDIVTFERLHKQALVYG